MSSHILIFGGFTSLLDDIHVILRHIPYPPGSSGICLFVHTVIIKNMSLVMTFLGFHHVLIDATLGHIPYLLGSFRGGRFVQTALIEDMSHCYDFLDFIMFMLDVILGHTPLTSPLLSSVHMFRLRLLHIRRPDFAFIWIRCSDFICITFASTVDHTFILCLLHIKCLDFAFIWIRCSDLIYITFASTTDQKFRLRLLHIRCSDFAFIWIRCSDVIFITFSSTKARRSDFVFCRSSVQTSPSYGSDVQTSFVSHLLAPQLDVQTSFSADQAFRLHLHMDQMFRLHLYHIF